MKGGIYRVKEDKLQISGYWSLRNENVCHQPPKDNC